MEGDRYLSFPQEAVGDTVSGGSTPPGACTLGGDGRGRVWRKAYLPT